MSNKVNEKLVQTFYRGSKGGMIQEAKHMADRSKLTDNRNNNCGKKKHIGRLILF